MTGVTLMRPVRLTGRRRRNHVSDEGWWQWTGSSVWWWPAVARRAQCSRCKCTEAKVALLCLAVAIGSHSHDICRDRRDDCLQVCVYIIVINVFNKYFFISHVCSIRSVEYLSFSLVPCKIPRRPIMFPQEILRTGACLAWCEWLDLSCLKLAIRPFAAWLCLVRRFCVRLTLCNVYYLLQRNLVFLLIISCAVNVVLTVVSCLCVSVCCSLFSCSYIIMASEYVSSMTVGLLSILENSFVRANNIYISLEGVFQNKTKFPS